MVWFDGSEGISIFPFQYTERINSSCTKVAITFVRDKLYLLKTGNEPAKVPRVTSTSRFVVLLLDLAFTTHDERLS